MNGSSLEPRTLDTAHLTGQTFGDQALEREVLALFEQQCERLLPVLAAAGAKRARSDAAHTLKGAALAIGAWRIAELAAEFERALDRGEGEEPFRIASDLRQAVLDVRGAIAVRRGAA